VRNKFYQVTPSVVVNLDYLHSMALNEDGEKGWLRMVKEVNGKLIIYPITKEQFAELAKILKQIGGQS
jgi:hypothetical protein